MSAKPSLKLISSIVKQAKSRHRLLFAFAIGTLFVVIGANLLSREILGQKRTIVLAESGFSPNYIKVNLGDMVIFRNESKEPFWPASNLHPSHGIYPEFDPKRQIGTGEGWIFTFEKPGVFNYHDHLHPNFTGVVEVSSYKGKKGRPTTQLKDCEGISDEAKSQCWDELLTYTIRKKGLDAAFEAFVTIYQSDPEIPKGCHGWSHILGREAYELFQKKQKFTLRKETSYCGFGFFHGFIEELLRNGGELSETKQFCEMAAAQLNNSQDLYSNCIHGIGHGSVDVDDVSLWGNFFTMLDQGLNSCEKVLTDPGDLGSCYVGAFNVLTQSISDGLYNLKLKDGELYGYCRQIEEKYKHYCYYEFTGLISAYTDHDFDKAVSLILSEDMDEDTRERVVGKMQAIWMTKDIAKPSFYKNVLNCRSLGGNLYKVCFDGILDGIMLQGEPSREYVRGFAFCEEEGLFQEEKDRCYEYIIGRADTQNPEVCGNVPTPYRNYCQN